MALPENPRKAISLPLCDHSGRTAPVSGCAVASRLHLSAVARTAVVTAAGEVLHDVVWLGDLMLGGVAKHALLVTVLTNADLEAVGAGLDGILGQDFLIDQNYTLDYEHRHLVWGAGDEAPGTAVRLPVMQVKGAGSSRFSRAAEKCSGSCPTAVRRRSSCLIAERRSRSV
jgi:hypothetical protein